MDQHNVCFKKWMGYLRLHCEALVTLCNREGNLLKNTALTVWFSTTNPLLIKRLSWWVEEPVQLTNFPLKRCKLILKNIFGCILQISSKQTRETPCTHQASIHPNYYRSMNNPTHQLRAPLLRAQKAIIGFVLSRSFMHFLSRLFNERLKPTKAEHQQDGLFAPMAECVN